MFICDLFFNDPATTETYTYSHTLALHDARPISRWRARFAHALFTSLGGGLVSPAPLPDLATADDLDRAARWGLAIRLGQRLSAGVAAPLKQSRLSLTAEAVTLDLPAPGAAFSGAPVERRHQALAAQSGPKTAAPPCEC